MFIQKRKYACMSNKYQVDLCSTNFHKDSLSGNQNFKIREQDFLNEVSIFLALNILWRDLFIARV